MTQVKDVFMVIRSDEEQGLEIKFCDWSVENEARVFYVEDYDYESLSDMENDFEKHTQHVEWFNKQSSRGGSASFAPPVNCKIVRVLTLVTLVE
jgi:hypothetical protein